jgi:1-acyl-sn-glycerol-3-phosphate acyltransferase
LKINHACAIIPYQDVEMYSLQSIGGDIVKQAFKKTVKLSGSVLIVAAYLLVSGVLTVFPLPSRTRRSVRIRTTSFFSRAALGLFGVRVRSRHPERLQSKAKGLLIIANHVSYVDVLVLSAMVPAVFITSIELKKDGLLGMLARFGGSLFVERRSPAGLKREIGDIAQVLQQGFPVVLFPEGTTSNGERVLPFKNSFFDSAVSAGADILPLCLKYTQVNGVPLSPLLGDSLFYYGGIRFTSHFPRFLSLRSVHAEVTPLKRISAHKGASRKELAAAAHAGISAAYRA